MWSWFHKLSSPKQCYQLISYIRPCIAILCITLFLIGLWYALIVAPPDYQQGEVYRIIYVHVPLAIWSLGVYVVMSACAFIYFIWKIKMADLIIKISAPIGAIFTVLTLLTGSIWGKPTWGTWWIWDARLTTELILLFIYLGVILIRYAIPELRLASRASALLTLLGTINIPIVHYSVIWWNTLHQGPSILKWSVSSIAPVMLHPLWVMIFAFFFYYIWILLIRAQHELLWREQKTNWVKTELETL